MDWVIIGLISCTFISTILLFAYLFLIIKNAKNYKSLMKKRSKKKGKKDKSYWNEKIFVLKRKQRNSKIVFYLLLMISLVSGASSIFCFHYQSIHLDKRDIEAVTKGNFYLKKIEENLQNIHESKDEAEIQRSYATLHELCGKFASYGARNADGRLATEGRILLNRMYVQMKNLGLNLNGQSIEMIKNKENYESYQSDIRKLKQLEKKVLMYFNINSLKLRN